MSQEKPSEKSSEKLWDQLFLTTRMLPAPVQAILTAEVHSAELRINNVRIAFGFIGLILLFLNQSTNSPGAIAWSATTIGIYTLGSGVLHWLLQLWKHRWWTRYFSIFLDMLAVTLFHFQSLYNQWFGQFCNRKKEGAHAAMHPKFWMCSRIRC
jgi:hypothetical protein